MIGIKHAIGWVKDRAMLVALALAMGVAVTLFFRLDHVADERAKAEASAKTAIAANENLNGAIERLEGRLERLDEIQAQRHTQQMAALDAAARQSQDLEELRNADATVDDYLNQPIPDALVRLLDDAGGGDGDSGGSDHGPAESAARLPASLPAERDPSPDR